MKLPAINPLYIPSNSTSVSVSEGQKISADKMEEIRKTVVDDQSALSDVPADITPFTVELSIPESKPSYVQHQGVVRYTPGGQLEREGKGSEWRLDALAHGLDYQNSNRTFSPGSILSNLTALNVSSGSYYDASRSYVGSVRVDEAGQPIKPGFNSFSDANTTATFSLDIETRDGDKVSIEIETEEGFGNFLRFNGTSFSLDIDGELDEDELEAIQALAVELSNASGAFYNGRGMVQLNGLQSFDREELAGFDLALNGELPSKGATFHFDIDEQSGEQTLEASQMGLKYNITLELNNRLVSENVHQDLDSNEQFLAYLKTIDSASRAYKAAGVSPRDIATFFKDGFSTAFQLYPDSSQEAGEPSPLEGNVSPQQAALAQSALSGLADFQADFFAVGRDGISPNPEKPSERSFMSLEMEQETKIRGSHAPYGGPVKVEQYSHYEADIRQHKPLPGLEQVDFENKNYQYETLKQQETLVRSLDIDKEGRLDSGSVAHTYDKVETEKEYREGRLEKDLMSKEQQATLLASTDLEALQQDKVNRQLGMYKIIDSLS